MVGFVVDGHILFRSVTPKDCTSKKWKYGGDLLLVHSDMVE